MPGLSDVLAAPRAPNEMQENGRAPAGMQGCDQSLDPPPQVQSVGAFGGAFLPLSFGERFQIAEEGLGATKLSGAALHGPGREGGTWQQNHSWWSCCHRCCPRAHLARCEEGCCGHLQALLSLSSLTGAVTMWLQVPGPVKDLQSGFAFLGVISGFAFSLSLGRGLSCVRVR